MGAVETQEDQEACGHADVLLGVRNFVTLGHARSVMTEPGLLAQTGPKALFISHESHMIWPLSLMPFSTAHLQVGPESKLKSGPHHTDPSGLGH